MPAFIDLSGTRFGKLTAIRVYDRTASGTIRWLCRCDCGNDKIVSKANLGINTNSCGCIRNTQGSMSHRHPLWGRWEKIIKRCHNPNDKDYKNYGGRGIYVEERWLSFPNFLEDMGPSFQEGLTINRIDNNGPYSRENCEWATPEQQSKNKRSSRLIVTKYGRLTIADTAKLAGLPMSLLYQRINRGVDVDQLFDPPTPRHLRRNSKKR